ncbi:hypothetical protein SmJEL517_g01787 [Synchytrium microbalum]|uniref:Rho-GAP domain-containing protein n=1 Tax=Synchytrium microbalum TaxID=1806994 RepID=A0A507C4K9_9FUNG|nr:uncharacterized protein SmJEL517_g01787 [Synchytrium microbalum]TPX35917.1 hypothetical protein SmJEL517_g01787 [Synchytrium microbalum]
MVVSPTRSTGDVTDEDLQELVAKRLILESGVDFESRPLLAIYGCYLPNPKHANYDRLLALIKDRLDQFVESDYAVVLFSSGASYQPPMTWFYSAYKQLGRKYRKNLKNLYIVHPNMLTKLLLQVMGTVISPKFFKKVISVHNLTQLETLIPIKQLIIPDVVRERVHANVKFEPKESSSLMKPKQLLGPKRYFGARLEDMMGKDGELGVPLVISDCIAYIRRDDNLKTEGLFRRSPSSQRLKDIKVLYERGEKVDLSSLCDDVHLPCVLIKMFFRELSQPIFPASHYHSLKILSTLGHAAAPIYIRTNVIPSLPPASRVLLKAIFFLLHAVSKQSSDNLMTPYNLTVVFGPNIFRSEDPLQDLAIASVSSSGNQGGGGGLWLMYCIERYPEIFGSDDEVTLIAAPIVDAVKTATLSVTERPQFNASKSPRVIPSTIVANQEEDFEDVVCEDDDIETRLQNDLLIDDAEDL